MKPYLLLILLLPPCCGWGQQRARLGLQVTPLALGTVDLHWEQEILRTLSWQAGMGVRYQELGVRDPRVGPLSNFVDRQNVGGYLAAGLRLFDPETGIDYPYLQFTLVASWYNEQFMPPGGSLTRSRGWLLGGTATFGYQVKLADRWHLDLGLQMGYAPPREDQLSYYATGMGYSTFGLGRYGVRGGHVQPVILLKYLIRMNARDRLYDTE